MLRETYILTKKRLYDLFKPSLETLVFFISPVLWIVVFLYLRHSKTEMHLPLGIVAYHNFLVLGLSIWRGVSQLLRSVAYGLSTEKSCLKTYFMLPKGKTSVFLSTLITAVTSCLAVSLIVIVVGSLFYNFRINLSGLILAFIVYILILLAHAGIGFIILSLTAIKYSMKSLIYVLTAIFALLSGVFYPASFYPQPLKSVAYLLPLTQGVQLIQNLLLFEHSYFDANLFIILLIMAFALFYVGYIMFKRNIHKYI